MTQKDESPNASEGPYWSEELLAVLVVGLGDETQARETLEGIIQQALSGKALQGLSEEALASYLSKLYERIAECVQDSDVARVWAQATACSPSQAASPLGAGWPALLRAWRDCVLELCPAAAYGPRAVRGRTW